MAEDLDTSIRLYEETKSPLTLEFVSKRQDEEIKDASEEDINKSSSSINNKNSMRRSRSRDDMNKSSSTINNKSSSSINNKSSSSIRSIRSNSKPRRKGSSSKEKKKKMLINVKIDKIDRDRSGGNQQPKLLVSVPPVLDTAHAGCAVDMLLDRWENDRYMSLHTLMLTGPLKFTKGGVAALTTFLGIQDVISGVQQIMFQNLIGVVQQGGPDNKKRNNNKDDNNNEADEDDTETAAAAQNIYSLCKAIGQNAKNLESINLNYNSLLGKYHFWEGLGPRLNKLKQLSLRGVDMDDSSFQQLQSYFNSGDTLQSLTISNKTSTGKMACEALDEILRSCRNLRTFVWEQQQQAQQSIIKNEQEEKTTSTSSMILPLAGLARLSMNMFKNDCGYMIHLELTGGKVPTDSLGTLCNALEGFHKLQFLKISHASLDTTKIQRIVTALRSSRPPLHTIDFSHNRIDCDGASWIAQLSCLRAVTKNLRLLNLDSNNIGQGGALEVMESFASKCSTTDFDLRLEGNQFDASKLFLKLASSKCAAETELRDLRKDCERLREAKKDAQTNLREMLKAQSNMINDMHNLQSKVKQLQDDKEGLVKAFSVMGMMQHVQERDNILARLAQLEEAVHNGSGEGSRHHHRHHSSSKKGFRNGEKDKEQAEPTCLWSRSRNEGQQQQQRQHKSRSFDGVTRPVPSASSAASSSRNPSSRAISSDEAPAPYNSFNRSSSSRSINNIPSDSLSGTRYNSMNRSSSTRSIDSSNNIPSDPTSSTRYNSMNRSSSTRSIEGSNNIPSDSFSSTTHANNLSRSPRSAGRPGTARHLMVKAASERWKSLIKDDLGGSEGGQDLTPIRSQPIRDKPRRARSSKSLAEYLNRSAPDVWDNDESFALLEDDSIQTTPAPSSLAGARRHFRQQVSSRSLQGDRQTGSSTRSLQGTTSTSTSPGSSSRNLVRQGSASRSLGSPTSSSRSSLREQRRGSGGGSSRNLSRSLPDREVTKSLPLPSLKMKSSGGALPPLDKMHDSFNNEELDMSSIQDLDRSSIQDFTRRRRSSRDSVSQKDFSRRAQESAPCLGFNNLELKQGFGR